MNKINYRITLDAHKGGVQKTLHGFFAGDVLSRRIAISLVGGSTPCEYGEIVAAVMYVTKPNGVTSYNACTVEENTIFYDVLQTDTDTAGIVTMQFKVMSGESVLYAPEFAIEVQASKNSDTQATTTPTYTALEEALVKAEIVHNSRLVSIDIEEDLTFVAIYADGTEYRSDALKKVFFDVTEIANAEQGRVEAEKLRVQAEEERVAEYTSLKESIADSAEKTITLQDEVQELIDEGLVTEDKVIELISEHGGGGGGTVTLPDNVLVASTESAGSATAPKLNAELFGSQLPEYYATAQSVTNIVNGTTVVGKATSATNATDATNATNATNADTVDNYHVVVVASDPGVGVSVSYPNGTIIFVKE